MADMVGDKGVLAANDNAVFGGSLLRVNDAMLGAIEDEGLEMGANGFGACCRRRINNLLEVNAFKA